MLKKLILGMILASLFSVSYAKLNDRNNEVVFTCDDFVKNIQSCMPYSCYVTLAGVTTVTTIIEEEQAGLCKVSSTVGVTLRPAPPKPGELPKPPTTLPVTTVCEYDRDGIRFLTAKFQAMKDNRFDLVGLALPVGRHNCTTFALGQSFPTPQAHPNKRTIWQ